MSEIIMLPIDQLSITSTNARKDHIADKAMIASLLSQGLLYPLLVEPLAEGYDVVDGARRLTCIREGIKTGYLNETVFARVPCIVGNGDGRKLGLEQSLHANLHMAMHPLDECEAILKLAEDEDDKAAIGLRFGQDEKWVDQRVKLAALCAEAKALFRQSEISLTAAMKFTLGTPAAQKAFLKRHAKEGFTLNMIDAGDDREGDQGGACELRPGRLRRAAQSRPVRRGCLPARPQEGGRAAGPVGGRRGHLLKQQGYDKVEILGNDDWQTLQNHVEVTGRISRRGPGEAEMLPQGRP